MVYKQSILLLMMFISFGAWAFPEIPFCPLGGPPGWYNRMSGEHRQYPYPPAQYPPPLQQGYLPAYPPYTGYPQAPGMPVNRFAYPGSF